MKIDMTGSDLNAPSGFSPVDFKIFTQTLEETEVTYSIGMGNGVTIHHGTREGAPIWLMENLSGHTYGNAIWVEEVE